MRWFKTNNKNLAHAVLTQIPAGIAAVRLNGEAGRQTLASCVVHEAGEWTAEALRSLSDEAKLTGCKLITLLNLGDYQTLVIEAPSVPEAEMKTALQWKVKDMLNFPLDQAVIEYLTLAGSESGRPRNLYVLAASDDVVRAMVAPFQSAHLPLEEISVREVAQCNIARLLEPEGYAVGLLHYDGSQGLLTFSYGGMLVMSRVVDGRNLNPDVVGERLALEAQRSVDNFERQYHGLPLAKVFISTPDAADGVQEKMREFLGVGVERADLGEHIDWGKFEGVMTERMQNRLFHALGTALRAAS